MKIYNFFYTGCMYFVNCVCNPFLYSLLSQSFRLECHKLLSNTIINCSLIFKKSFVKSEHHYGLCQENKSNSMVLYKNEKVDTSLINPVRTIDIA